MRHTVVQFTEKDDVGGTGEVILQLLGGLDRQRWRPLLMHYGDVVPGRLTGYAAALGVELRRVQRVSRGADVPSHFIPLMRAIRAERPDVFHAHLPATLSAKWALVAAAVARVPAVVATAHLYTDVPAGWRGDANHRVARACVDQYIAVSDEVARRLRARFGMAAPRIQVVRNGIDADRYCRATDGELRRALTTGDSQAVVLTVARLDPQKGHEFLLAAAAAVTDAVFVIAGDGPLRPQLEGMARTFGVADRVRFLGHRGDVPDLLAACDVFVLPSRYEGLPLAVLEAMAAGKPVVATDVGGTDEAVVHGQSGLLVAPGDPSALVTAIRNLLQDVVLARRLGEAGAARVRQEFSVDRMVRETAGVYERLLQGSYRRDAGR